MKEELITFETAKLAKKRGYFYKGLMYTKEGIITDGGGFLNNGEYSAPTQSILQRWLREKYGIHIRIDTTNSLDKKNPSKWEASFHVPFNPFRNPSYERPIGDTYEEALEKALFIGLNKIKHLL